MPIVRHRPGLLAGAIAVICVGTLAACADGGTEPPGAPTTAPTTPSATASPTGPSASPRPSASPTPSPLPEPSHLQLPPDAPSTVEDPQAITEIAAGDLGPLLPPGATVAFADVEAAPFDQIAIAWERGEDPFAAERGFALWQRTEDRGAWHAVYAFTDAPRRGVLGIQRPQHGDLTGDGVDELVTFEDRGGTGACGVTRVISPRAGAADEIYKRATCDAETSLVGTALEIREAVYGPEDPHCCPSAFRTTTLEWDGERFVETGVAEESV
jgi:hypothetical protein